MIHRMATFEVRKESLPQALAAIESFLDEVGRKEGGTAAYRSFQHAETPTRFTHYMEFRTPSAADYHRKTAWCKRFVETLYPLCTAEPVTFDVKPVQKA
jgi:quinol monooxygenase YgiN